MSKTVKPIGPGVVVGWLLVMPLALFAMNERSLPALLLLWLPATVAGLGSRVAGQVLVLPACGKTDFLSDAARWYVAVSGGLVLTSLMLGYSEMWHTLLETGGGLSSRSKDSTALYILGTLSVGALFDTVTLFRTMGLHRSLLLCVGLIGQLVAVSLFLGLVGETGLFFLLAGWASLSLLGFLRLHEKP